MGVAKQININLGLYFYTIILLDQESDRCRPLVNQSKHTPRFSCQRSRQTPFAVLFVELQSIVITVSVDTRSSVSYTHLTLPTIYSV